MAIYQFIFSFETPFKLSEVENKISLYFKKNIHWNKELLLFGDIDSSCFEIDENEICVRLDISKINKDILLIIDDILSYLTDYIVVDEIKYPYSLNILVSLIKQSTAFNFCENPKRFLENIRQKGC